MELILELYNPKDNTAIAFRCFLNGRWHKFGYVVYELLDEVHTAISLQEIINTTFKELSTFLRERSATMVKKGCWSSEAVKHASTWF